MKTKVIEACMCEMMTMHGTPTLCFMCEGKKIYEVTVDDKGEIIHTTATSNATTLHLLTGYINEKDK
jgi:hypothetical protein